jgi:hypothetical protein
LSAIDRLTGLELPRFAPVALRQKSCDPKTSNDNSEDSMTIAARLAIFATTVATFACSTTPIQTTDPWGNSKYTLAQEDPATAQRHDAASAHITRVAALSYLSGRFQGTSPEND